MAASMMSQFAASGFEPIEFEGELVHPLYRVAIAEHDIVQMSWLSAASPRVQGISMRLRIPGRAGRRGEGGLLRVEEVRAPTIILWMDTAPATVEAECTRLAAGAELQVSNRWRHPDGREDEWLNNYGIKVERVEEASTVLHCSDGYGDRPTFDDLVVRLDMLPRPQA